MKVEDEEEGVAHLAEVAMPRLNTGNNLKTLLVGKRCHNQTEFVPSWDAGNSATHCTQ